MYTYRLFMSFLSICYIVDFSIYFVVACGIMSMYSTLWEVRCYRAPGCKAAKPAGAE